MVTKRELEKLAREALGSDAVLLEMGDGRIARVQTFAHGVRVYSKSGIARSTLASALRGIIAERVTK